MSGSMSGPRITCRRFERHVSDWLSGRLSSERSEEMAAHEKVCASCRHAAQEEAKLRRCFREAGPPPVLPDLWPRLALRLETEMPKTSLRGPALHPRRWVIAAAIMLAALAACWNQLPVDTGAAGSRAAEAEKTLPAPAGTASSTASLTARQDAAWSQFGTTVQVGNAVQDDPALDDPVGSNMENIWTCLNADSK